MRKNITISVFLLSLSVGTLFFAGCKIQINVSEGGNVTTSSGAYECHSGQTCTIDINDLFFDEEFIAEPTEGFQFVKWKKVERGLCAGKNIPCRIVSDWARLHQFFMAILESDNIFYLEPEFDVYGSRVLTERVSDIVPGTGSGEPWNLIDVNDSLLFTALADGKSAIWKSEGTNEGTVILKEFAPDEWGGDPGAFSVANGQLFFRGTDYQHGTELWVTDGTAAGTVMTRDIWEGPDRGLLSVPTPFKNGVLFIADDGLSGPQFWVSDGTETATRRFIDPAISTEAKARNFWSFGRSWLFKSTDPEHGAELWITNGLEGGSRLVKDIVPGPVGSFSTDPFSFAELDRAGVFWVWKENNAELWLTDGTAVGTKMIWATPDGLMPDYKLFQYGNIALFFLENSTNDWSLWRTDGTEAGTFLLKAGFIDTTSSYIEYKDFLYLTLMTNDRASGNELWRTDGTAEGTQLFVDLNQGAASSSPSDLTRYGDWLYFRANDGIHGEELYRTDGIAEGTELVADIAPGPESSFPDELTVSHFSLFFSAQESTTGRELYRTRILP